MLTLRTQDLIEAINSQYPDQPLEQLTAAVLNAQALASAGDALVDHFVEQARASGNSWQAIGSSLGVTKQAAQKRFTPKQSQNMFTMFTEQARLAIMQAQEEARAAHASEIAPEHLFLGLIGVADGTAVEALLATEQEPLVWRDSIHALLPDRSGEVESPSVIAFDQATRVILESSLAQSMRLDSALVGTGHVLLALLEDQKDSVFAALDAQAIESFVRSTAQAR